MNLIDKQVKVWTGTVKVNGEGFKIVVSAHHLAEARAFVRTCKGVSAVTFNEKFYVTNRYNGMVQDEEGIWVAVLQDGIPGDFVRIERKYYV